MKTKNKRGFTLIELLVVIVVLAIIALIATPILMKTIKNAKKGAAERSADSYIKQVETTVATERLEGNVLEGEYTIQSDGDICPVAGCTIDGEDKKVKIEVSGNKPSKGSVTITNGSVSKLGTKLVIGDYNVKYKDDKLIASEVYKGVLCKANTTKVSALVWVGGYPGQESSYTSEEVGLLASEATSKYDAGVTYTCELGDGEQNIFYVLETNGDNVSLISGMNLGSAVAWSEDGSNHAGEDESKQAVTAKAALKERTTGWIKLDENQITLPSGQQIAIAGGDTKWNTSTSGDGFKSAKWLSGYIKYTTGIYCYWTSSPKIDTTNDAWCVSSTGNFTNNYVSNSVISGVRPVITISKSQLG